MTLSSNQFINIMQHNVTAQVEIAQHARKIKGHKAYKVFTNKCPTTKNGDND